MDAELRKKLGVGGFALASIVVLILEAVILSQSPPVVSVIEGKTLIAVPNNCAQSWPLGSERFLHICKKEGTIVVDIRQFVYSNISTTKGIGLSLRQWQEVVAAIPQIQTALDEVSTSV